MAAEIPQPTRGAVLEQLGAAIAAVRLDHPTRVAIDGVDGSGKTTLADELVEPISRAGRDVIRASVDGFHNPRAARYARGPDSPEGRWDVTIWLDVPFEVTAERAVARDSRNGRDAAVTRGKYQRRYVPGQRLHLTLCRPRERADIVVDNTALYRPKTTIRARGDSG